jgi:hypothetical protein
MDFKSYHTIMILTSINTFGFGKHNTSLCIDETQFQETWTIHIEECQLDILGIGSIVIPSKPKLPQLD